MKLDELFSNTSFREDREPPTWDQLSIDEADGHVFAPQGSYLGHTLIVLNDTYENSGDDCLFIQELLKAWMDGRVQILD